MMPPLSKIVYSTARTLLAAGALCGLAGCGGMSSSTTTTVTPPVTTTPADVYAAGTETIGTQTKAAVWKNGTETVLNSGTFSARAASVAVANGHVYMVGSEVSASGNDEAVIWDNGVATKLTITSVIGDAYGRVALGTDVYVAGGDGTPTTTPGVNSFKAALWKNGVESILPDAGDGAIANAITTDGTNIFVGGGALTVVPNTTGATTLVQSAAYWKNGALTLLNDGTTIALVTSMAIGNGHVYLAGALCSLSLPDCTAAAYWEDSSTFPQAPAVFSSATGIALSGSNVYQSENIFPATATTNNTAALVTNGSITTLSAAAGAAANSVVTYNGDVYVGGALNSMPTYWKNGQSVTLTTTAKIASLTAMAVVPAGT